MSKASSKAVSGTSRKDCDIGLIYLAVDCPQIAMELWGKPICPPLFLPMPERCLAIEPGGRRLNLHTNTACDLSNAECEIRVTEFRVEARPHSTQLYRYADVVMTESKLGSFCAAENPGSDSFNRKFLDQDECAITNRSNLKVRWYGRHETNVPGS